MTTRSTTLFGKDIGLKTRKAPGWDSLESRFWHRGAYLAAWAGRRSISVRTYFTRPFLAVETYTAPVSKGHDSNPAPEVHLNLKVS